MLDSTKFESSYRGSAGDKWLQLTEREIHLIALYRQMSESNRKQIRRISGFLVEEPDSNSPSL